MTHHWSFDGRVPYKDIVTGEVMSVIGANPLNSSDYLSFKGPACAILGSFEDLCLTNLTKCNAGFTLAFWLQIDASANDSQIFIGTSSNGGDIQGVFVYQTKSSLAQRRIIAELCNDGVRWKVSLSAPQETWHFIVMTWNAKDTLRVHKNGKLVNSTSVGTQIDQSLKRLFKLRGLSSGDGNFNFLYLESRGKYDELMTWKRTLNERDVKRTFQIQMNKLSRINCTATLNTLNVTWQRLERNVFPEDYGFVLEVWRSKGSRRQNFKTKDLNPAITHYVIKDLDPFVSYKVRLWMNTSAGEKRVGAMHCQTNEGVPTRVENLRIIPQTSTSLLVRWAPPVQINGIIQGYSLVVDGGGTYRQITVRDQGKFLITGLKANSLYTISVDAFTSSGRGPRTQEKNARTREVPQVTDSPSWIQAFAAGWDTIWVKWTPLDKEEVMSYDVQACSVLECSTWTTLNNSLILRDLQQYTSYKIKVRGKNALNSGPWLTAREEVKTLDLDECETGQHLCNALALCTNTAGSYECRCMSGLSGDGYMCKGSVSRKCLEVKGIATWQKPDLKNCVSKPLLDLMSQLSLKVIDSDTLVSMADSLMIITDPSRDEPLVIGDLHTAINILETLGQAAAKNGTMMKRKIKKFMKNVVQVASNLLDEKAMKVWQDSVETSSLVGASKLLRSLESMSLMTASISNSTEPVFMKTRHVVVNVQSFEKDNALPERLLFPRGSNVPRGILQDRGGIALPSAEMMRKISNKGTGLSMHIAFMYIKNIGQLLTPSSTENEKTSSNRHVMTASSDVMSINTEASGNFHEPVILTFRSSKSNALLQPLCVFWNEFGEGGSWSSKGCSVIHTNSSHIVCHCYHLTSFTVLMQYTPASYNVQLSHEVALSIITYVGIAISLVALLLALITFCSFNFLKSNRNFAHINLTISLIMAELLFVVGINKTQYQTGCFVIAVTLHYLFLVVFCWMATEGIILYLMLVKVFPASREGPKKRVLFLSSWGIPVVPVGTAILSFREGYTSNRHCWLSIERGFIWSFLGPVVVICLVNIVFLGLTFKTMAERSVKQPGRKPSHIRFRYWGKTCAVLTCLLGTTWLLGLFFVSKSSVIMAYLFNISNVLQGFSIFVFHCLADERIRAEYKRIICCRGSRRDYLRTKAVAKSAQQKTSSTATTRITDRKTNVFKGQKRNSSSDPVTLTRDSSGYVFPENQQVQKFDPYLNNSPLSETLDNLVDNSEAALALEIEQLPDNQEEGDVKSVDNFCEDISLSLINVRQDRENGYGVLTPHLKSLSSTPRGITECSQSRCCLTSGYGSDMDFSSHFLKYPSIRKGSPCNKELQSSLENSHRKRDPKRCVSILNNDRVIQRVENVFSAESFCQQKGAYCKQHSCSHWSGVISSPSHGRRVSSSEDIYPQIAVSENSDLDSDTELNPLTDTQG